MKYLLVLAAVLVSLAVPAANTRAADPGIVIDELGLVSVLEGSPATDTYAVTLGSMPTAAVIVSVTTPDNQVFVSPASLTFTADNWTKPQTVTVEAYDDTNYEQAHNGAILHTAASADTGYNGKSASVRVSITDNDATGSGGGKDSQAPRVPSDIKYATDGKTIAITWTDPVELDFRMVDVLRNSGGTTPVNGVVYMPIAKGEQKFTDTAVTAGQSYTYQLRFMDWSGNARVSSEQSIKVEAAAVATPVPTPSPAPVVPTTPPLPTVTAPPAIELGLVRSDAKTFGVTLTTEQESALAYYYLNGMVRGSIADYAVELGAGERRALIRDYFETVGRADVAWDDLARMSRGEKPLGRNLAKEQSQARVALAMWLRVKGRSPNFKNPSEDLAWNTLMYRIRFNRDLTKETTGISKFRIAFRRSPVSPMDWAMVRALAYVLWY